MHGDRGINDHIAFAGFYEKRVAKARRVDNRSIDIDGLVTDSKELTRRLSHWLLSE
jgi:hypothetical protein